MLKIKNYIHAIPNPEDWTVRGFAWSAILWAIIPALPMYIDTIRHSDIVAFTFGYGISLMTLLTHLLIYAYGTGYFKELRRQYEKHRKIQR